jgi:hypothetical protein
MRQLKSSTSFAALLALTLAACSGQVTPLPQDVLIKKADVAKFDVPASPWPAASPVEGVTLELDAPKSVASAAAVLQARIALENRTASPITVTVPTSCAIRDWRITDRAGQQIMRKRATLCEPAEQNRELKPGEVIEETATIPLTPNVLNERRAYRLEYRFWGQPAIAQFAVE